MRRLCCACPAVGPLLLLPIFVLFKVHLMKCRMLKFRCSFALVFRCQKWSALGLSPHFPPIFTTAISRFNFVAAGRIFFGVCLMALTFWQHPQRFHPGFPSSFSPTSDLRPPPLGRLVIWTSRLRFGHRPFNGVFYVLAYYLSWMFIAFPILPFCHFAIWYLEFGSCGISTYSSSPAGNFHFSHPAC